jgi:Spx/MgsR family transcriptional regulator
MQTITIYGIPNCDTIKKTLDWFKQKNIPIIFHDYKKAGISKEKLKVWCNLSGWEILLNKKSATWRGLSPEEQSKITSQAAAIQLMTTQNSIIKRPVIEVDGKLLVGFDTAILNNLFA